MAEDQRLILELKNIQKSFGSLKALDDVSLDLQFGEVLGLVGDNAAGKSTLMKILSGFYQADKGSIFDIKRLKKTSRRKKECYNSS